MDTYSTSVPKNRAARSVKQSSGKLLKELFKETDSILKERMDKLVTVFNDTNPDFVSAGKDSCFFL